MYFIYFFIAFCVGAVIGCIGEKLQSKGEYAGDLICDLDDEYIFKLELHEPINDICNSDIVRFRVIRKHYNSYNE